MHTTQQSSRSESTVKPGSNSSSLAPGRAVQAKLNVNEPGDDYEREADAMADHVMRSSVPPAGNPHFFSPATSALQRKCRDCEEEDKEIQRKESSSQAINAGGEVTSYSNSLSSKGPKSPDSSRNFFETSFARDFFGTRNHHDTDVTKSAQGNAPVHTQKEKKLHRKETNAGSKVEGSNLLDNYVGSLGSSGRALPENSRRFFEPRFGRDFSNVKIHTDSGAVKSAQSINALAYTTGNNIVFDASQYSPDTDSGKRLIAHELTHVVQQESIVDKGSKSMIQLQPALSVPTSGASVDDVKQGSDEIAHIPSFRIRLVAHASPRFKSAKDPKDADKRNFELSQRRKDAVRLEVENLFLQYFGSGKSVNIELAEDDEEGTVGVDAIARGSQDTLIEAKGDRSDDDADRRRVDIHILSYQHISGQAGVSQPQDILRPTASKWWEVSVNVSAGAAFGVAGSYVTLSLENTLSGETVQGHAFMIGGGPKASIGVSQSIWSGSTSFNTDQPVDFIDFDGVTIRYTTFGIQLFVGGSVSYISFSGMGNGAQSINVSGGSTGTISIGGSIQSGTLTLDKPLPPTSIIVDHLDDAQVPYFINDNNEAVYKVLFANNKATLSDTEKALLESFVISVITSTK